jgi:hypothetical protein
MATHADNADVGHAPPEIQKFAIIIGYPSSMFVFIGLTIVVVLLCLVGFYLLGLLWFFRRLNARWYDWSWAKRLGFFGAGVVVFALPYLASKAWELNGVLARVPDPLHVSWIEYREEEAWGIGGPGDNETGFVIYRLTERSAAWARAQKAGLRDTLPGGASNWRPTPVADLDDGGREWHADDHDPLRPLHGPEIKEYLNKYGFGIRLDQRQVDQVNRAIRTPGSFYSYGRGGSITIVDPRHGKVYFAYAG